MASSLLCSVLMLALMAVSVLTSSTGVEGKTWVVGDSQGWSAIDYSAWLKDKVFTVGDELVFPYSEGAQDVAEVSQVDYETCNGKNSLNHWVNGDTHLQLTTEGSKYFICTFPGHCPALRLAINVLAANSTNVPTNQSGSDANSIASNQHNAPPSPKYYNGNNTNDASSANVAPLVHFLRLFILGLWALFS
ncbi:hypothetical protein L7F22_017883 [Adiantum nelumboides]|nr:hypothetical protein [Adiantum nelumboides]